MPESHSDRDDDAVSVEHVDVKIPGGGASADGLSLSLRAAVIAAIVVLAALTIPNCPAILGSLP